MIVQLCALDLLVRQVDYHSSYLVALLFALWVVAAETKAPAVRRSQAQALFQSLSAKRLREAAEQLQRQEIKEAELRLAKQQKSKRKSKRKSPTTSDIITAAKKKWDPTFKPAVDRVSRVWCC